MFRLSIAAAWVVFLIAGCTRPATQTIVGDSLVLAGESPGRLLATNVRPRSVIVRSTYEPGGTIYQPGRDYCLDPAAGSVARTPGSRIPDFSTNVLFGRKDFDHSQFPGYGNGKFFVYVDYVTRRPVKLTSPRDASTPLAKTAGRLRAGARVKVIAFGDSITDGGEASTVALQYSSRYVDDLRRRFPRAEITIENGSTGGDNTVQGLARLEEKVLSRRPDLVLVAFGMNDHNRPGGGGVAAADFKQNLKTIVARIREKTGADVILLSAFPPHPDWHFGTHRMEQYARATQAAASESGVAYADVFAVWQNVLARKDPSSLLGNNINHPNDFGHWLYLQALRALEF
jgi:lysophospholipase L1-like esterase